MNGDFPRMLYRRGNEAVIFDNLEVDSKIVNNEAELAAALADGWHADVSSLNKLRYQEGGDPPTPEGGQPADHDWDKGLQGQRGRADRFPDTEELDKAREKAAKDTGAPTGLIYPPGNPPRSEDRSVPPPPAETEGAEEMRKNPGAATERAIEEFAEQAEEDADKNYGERRDKDAGGKRRGRPRKEEAED